MTPTRRANLARLLNPRQVAFIGGRDAAIAIGEARRIGYRGAMWPVNPNRETLAELRCFPSIADLPEAPDATFLAVPADQSVEVVRQLGQRGAGGIVCYTAGFGESGEIGERAEAALIEAAGDMALIGPNCYGLINYTDRVALWPFAHGGWCPGFGAAIITQSGMLSSDLTMSQRSVPFTHMISIGNQAVLAIEDLVDVLSEKPEVRAIGLHVEGFRSVDRFASAATKAMRLGKPIVAMKTGSSTIGKALTASHTGSLSGDDDLFAALCDRLGVIVVDQPSTLLETLKFLCVSGAPKGRRVAAFTCSGGGATMVADRGETLGLDFPPPDAATRQLLTALLPPIATVSNPLDYTTPIWGQGERTRPVFEALIGAGSDATLLVQDYPAAGLDESAGFYLADGDAFADAAAAAGVPGAIISTLPENIGEPTRRHFISRGVTPLQGFNEAMQAIAGAAGWSAACERCRTAPPKPLLQATPGPGRYIDEAAAKALLTEAGLAVPQGEACRGGDAAAAASRVGWPVALKMIGDQLLHKTEVGAVALNLRSPEAVSQAVEQMRREVTRLKPQALTEMFLVEAMQPPPLAELVVGIRQDVQYGMAMTLGSGGIFVELVRDARTLLLPSGGSEIAAALRSLKIARLLSGFRGRPAANLDPVAAALCELAQFAIDRRAQIREIEINPLFVYESSVCAVDALVAVGD
jgi:acyl-CoA synthetase (NDP forming)